MSLSPLEDAGARALVFCDAVAPYVEELGIGADVVLVTTGRHRVARAEGFEAFLAGRGGRGASPQHSGKVLRRQLREAL